VSSTPPPPDQPQQNVPPYAPPQPQPGMGYPPQAGYPPQQYGYPGQPPADNSKKLAAGLCGIFLGYLGIHKFILGYKNEGLVMLLVSVLTCFIGAIPMSIIGLIEGIIYLTKSDEEFHRTYVVGRKGWF
jgi:TM2 domain-containing membrane protein YozV